MEEDKKPKNEPAFAAASNVRMQHGMTLRDYFAATAMNGALASGKLKEDLDNETLAGYFYELADSMLKEREK